MVKKLSRVVGLTSLYNQLNYFDWGSIKLKSQTRGKASYKKISKSQTKKERESEIIHRKAINLAKHLKWGKGATTKVEQMITDAIGTPCHWCGNKLTIDNISMDHKNPINRTIDHINPAYII